MKINFKNTLPLMTLGAGGLGLCLRIWLLRSADAQGLLRANHFAGIAGMLLFAVYLALLFFSCRTLTPAKSYRHMFPASVWGAVGCAAGTAGIVYNLLSQTAGAGLLSIVCYALGIAAALCLVLAGYCRLNGQHPNFVFHVVVTVYFMLHLVLRCRTWGAEPQLHLYFFPFIGTVFLVLAAYNRAALDAGKKQRSWYVFFNQAAAFCCLVCVAGEGKLFYLFMAAWLMTNLGDFKPRRQFDREEN